MVHTTLLLVSLLSGVAFAANDWSKPCFDGVCFYDTPSGSASMKIWGSSDAITDITKAAGWTVLNCDPNALSQDIRLVCHAGDGCEHLWQNIGAVGKLVRLPENCGQSAFARISRNWVHQDQSIPDSVARSIRRRDDGTDPEVQGLAVDTDFAAVDPDVTGDVNIAIEGTNIPDATGDAEVLAPQRRSRIANRGLFSSIENAFKKFNSFDKDVTKSLPPIDVSKDFPIFDQSISCPAAGDLPAFSAALKAGVSAKAHAVISLGVATSGTIVPPKLKEFGAFAGLDATLDGTLTLTGSVSGTADSGLVEIFSTGIPGLDFPGILTIGPTFKINGQAKANLDAGVDLTVDLSYTVGGAKLFFPSSSTQKSGGTFSPADSPLKLSVTPSVASKGTVEAHVIPSVNLGVSGIGGLAQATIFLNLDASAIVTLTLNAKAEASVALTDVTTTSASAGVDGCVDVGTGFDVNAGADGSFFGIFDKNTKVNLFSKKFDLFKKCFGAATARRELPSSFSRRSSSLSSSLNKRFDLGCPAALVNTVAVVDETAKAV